MLLLLDAGVTVAWQEPISAYKAERSQAQLHAELEEAPPRQRVGRFDAGEPIGTIAFPSLDESYVFVQGTTQADLRRGPGHYPDTPLPGRPGTVAIAGHRTTYGAPFRDIDQLVRGDPIVIRTPYGRFAYRVQKQMVVEPTDTWVTDRRAYDRLVLSACHPLYSAAERLIVFARLIDEQWHSARSDRRPVR